MDVGVANSRLRKKGIRITIIKRRGWLYLRVVLPPKRNPIHGKPRRQEITRPKVGIPATSEGLKEAQEIAYALWKNIADGRFNWSTWFDDLDLKHLKNTVKAQEKNIEELVDDFHEYLLKTNSTINSTWDKCKNVFNRLPKDKQLTADILKSSLQEIPDHTTTRVLAISCYERLAKFANLTVDLRAASQADTSLNKKIPNDEVIAKHWERIPNDQWRWVYGCIAVLGVRPSEAFFAKPTDNPMIWHVTTRKNKKVDTRIALALYPEWVDRWDLVNGNPPSLSYEEISQYGRRVSQQFRRYGIPFTPYDLRHAYALRCEKFKVPMYKAAEWMGHSASVHYRIYEKWLTSCDLELICSQVVAEGPQAP